MTTKWDPHSKSKRNAGVIAIDAKRSKPEVTCGERDEPMPFRQKTRDLARSLVTCEAEAGTTSAQAQPAAVRVYEKLRRQLGSSVGMDGFNVLASRALALARVESSRLSAVQIANNGGLWGLGADDSRAGADEDGEAGINLIAQLLGLFLSFLGEATTLRLIEDLRLQSDVNSEPVSATTDATDSEGVSLAMAVAFEDLLQETDRLRRVSARIETLVNQHPDMEEGLLSVAGNIRSIASVLDVFTLIRSNAGGSQEVGSDPGTNLLMN